MSPKISIVICTLRRPQHLAEALDACAALDGAEAAEVIVVDNSAEGSAEAQVIAAAAHAPSSLRYVHEPRTNVSHARNKGLEVAAAPLIGFIDDDMRPNSGWLRAVLSTMDATAADLLFGAVVPVSDEPGDAAPKAGLRYFGRALSLGEGARMRVRRSGHLPFAGTNNAVVRRATCLVVRPWFDPEFGRSGGEDADFFLRLGKRGVHAVWSAEAWASEIVSARRAEPNFVTRKEFIGSHNYARALIKNSERPAGTKIALTCIGAAQAARLGLTRLALAASGGRAKIDARVAMAQALGKMCWMRPAGSWWEAAR